MNDQQRQTTRNAYRVPSLFAVFIDAVLDQDVVRIGEHLHCRQNHSMLRSIDPIFRFVPFEAHGVIHNVSRGLPDGSSASANSIIEACNALNGLRLASRIRFALRSITHARA